MFGLVQAQREEDSDIECQQAQDRNIGHHAPVRWTQTLGIRDGTVQGAGTGNLCEFHAPYPRPRPCLRGLEAFDPQYKGLPQRASGAPWHGPSIKASPKCRVMKALRSGTNWAARGFRPSCWRPGRLVHSLERTRTEHPGRQHRTPCEECR